MDDFLKQPLFNAQTHDTIQLAPPLDDDIASSSRQTFLIYILLIPSFFSILLLLIVKVNPSLERSSPSFFALAELSLKIR